MNIKSFFITTAAGLGLAACQSNTYRIEGTAEGAQEGDTLFLTTDMETGLPRDTMIVGSDGRFGLSGETDSTYFCLIYSRQNEQLNASIFVEPGTIKVLMKQDPGATRVGGTKVNDEWQRMNDSTMAIGKEINEIAERVYNDQHSTQEKELKAMTRIEELNQRFNGIVARFAERNIRNELGYFLLIVYPEEIIPNDERLRLIRMLPDRMRRRTAVQELEHLIGNSERTAEGATISDFTMPSMEGAPMSIMSEIKKNRLTVIDFWASWCGPCRQEMPLMKDIYKQYHDRGLGIVGISLDEDAAAWRQATDQLGIVWPQMSDLKGWQCEAAQMFNVTSIPHTIVVDADGKILARGLRGLELEQFIAERLQ